MVMTLMLGSLIDDKIAYSDVVLPLPVGPVSRIMPLGLDTSRFSNFSRPGPSVCIKDLYILQILFRIHRHE